MKVRSADSVAAEPQGHQFHGWKSKCVNPASRWAVSSMKSMSTAGDRDWSSSRTSLYLIVAWVLVGGGAALLVGTYEPAALLLVTTGTLVAVAAVFFLSSPSAFGRWFLLLPFVVTAVVEIRYPFSTTPGYPWSIAVLVMNLVATLVIAIGIARSLGPRCGSLRFLVLIALAGASGIATVISFPSPQNDVWHMYQAAANATLHGHNFYLTHWADSFPGEVSNQFDYLPVSSLLLTPFFFVFGDVRFGLLAATLFASWCSYKTVGPRYGWISAGLILIVPGIDFGLVQSWNDPLLLAGISAMVLAVHRRRLTWATVAFAVVLSTKQYAWLFWPLAALWRDFGWRRALVAAGAAVVTVLPWALAAPGTFWHSVVVYNFKLRPRLDSLSIYTALMRRGIDPGYAFIALLVVISLGIAILAVRRHGLFGFVVGCAIAMAGFNLASKQSFYNEWELSVGLLAMAVGLSLERDAEHSVSEVELDRAETHASI